MMDSKQTERELQQAATLVAETMLTNLPSPAECEHTFTVAFEEKLDILCRKGRRKMAVRRVGQRIAAVLITVFLALTMWLAVDAEARERVFRWMKEVYQNMIVYTFEGDEIEEELAGYEPSWIPEGFTLEESNQAAGQNCDIYVKQDTGDVFLIECTLMNHAAMSITVSEPEDAVLYDINGMTGEFYRADETTANQSLIWFDERTNMVFTVQGSISEQDIVHIARSLTLSDSTK